MYISSDFLNKNAHKFFNSNVEKNSFSSLNRVRFMSGVGAAGAGSATYTPYGAQTQQDNKGVTDKITTVIRSPADLQALTKGGNAYLPPDIYAALARGEEVAVTLSQRPPERVNLLVPVFAAIAQMAGSGGAAYNQELGQAIQGVDKNGNVTKGTGLNAAADFVNRFGGDYGLNPFGGATHIDIDAQYAILTKKQNPVKAPPYSPPIDEKQRKINMGVIPREKDIPLLTSPPTNETLPGISTGTVHFDTKNSPKLQKELNAFLSKNPPPPMDELKSMLGGLNFSEVVLDPKTKGKLDAYIASQQEKLGLNSQVFDPKKGKVDLSKVPAGKEDVAKDFVELAVDAHEIGTRSQVDTTKDGRKAEYTHTLLGGDEYLVPFAKDLSKQGIDISSLRGKNGQIDQEKVMALVDSLNGNPSSDSKINELSASIKGKPDLAVTVHDEKLSVSAGAGKVSKDFKDLGLGQTEEQFAMSFFASSTDLGKLTYNNASKTFTDSSGKSYTMDALKKKFPELSMKPFGNTFSTSIVVTPNNIPTLPNTSSMSPEDKFNAEDSFVQGVMGLGDTQTQSNLGPARITPQEYQVAKDKGVGSSEWKALVRKANSSPSNIKFAAEDYSLRMSVSSGKISNNDYLAASASHIKNKNSIQWKDLVTKSSEASFSPAARAGISNYLNTCLQHGVISSDDLSKVGVSDIKTATPDQLRKLFKTAENQLGKEGLGVGGTGSDGLLGSHHITALQMHIINGARSISGGASVALKSYQGSDLSKQETQSLNSLVSSYNKANPNQQIDASKPLSKDSLAKLVQYSSSELSKIKTDVTSSAYGSHPELKQMTNEIDAFTYASKGVVDKLNNPPASAKLTANPASADATLKSNVIALRNESADLSEGIQALSKLYNGEGPLSEDAKDQLRKLDPYNAVVDTILADPFSSDSRALASSLLTNASNRLGEISSSAKDLKKGASPDNAASVDALISDIGSLVSKSGEDNDINELSDFIQKGDVKYEASVSNSLQTIENRIKDMSAGKININSEIEVDGKVVKAKDYLKKIETDFASILNKSDPAVLQKPEFKSRVATITNNFSQLNASSSGMAEDFASIMTDIDKAEKILYAPKPEVKPEAKLKGIDYRLNTLKKSPNRDEKTLGEAMSSLSSKKGVKPEDVQAFLKQLSSATQNNAEQMFKLAEDILAKIKLENKDSLSNMNLGIISEIYSKSRDVGKTIEDASAKMFPPEKVSPQPNPNGTAAEINKHSRTPTTSAK